MDYELLRTSTCLDLNLNAAQIDRAPREITTEPQVGRFLNRNIIGCTVHFANLSIPVLSDEYELYNVLIFPPVSFTVSF